MDEVVGIKAQTVVQEVGLQTDIELRRGLPLNLLITYIGELCTNLLIVVANSIERSACCIVADVVITTHIEARIQAQVVDTSILGEPILVREHPAQLHAGEDGPFHASQLHATLGIGTETTVGLSKQRHGSEVFVHVVIVARSIPLHVLPHIINTSYSIIDIITCSQFGVLIILTLGRVLC